MILKKLLGDGLHYKKSGRGLRNSESMYSYRLTYLFTLVVVGKRTAGVLLPGKNNPFKSIFLLGNTL